MNNMNNMNNMNIGNNNMRPPVNNANKNNKPVFKPLLNKPSKDGLFPSMNNVSGFGKSLAIDAFDQSLFAINMGFTLAAVLAWHEAIKTFISSKIPTKQMGNSHLISALVLTIVGAMVFKFIKKVRPNTNRPTILPVAGIM